MTTTEAPTDQGAGNPSPGQAFGMALDAVVGAVAAKLERKTAGWADKLESVATKNRSSDTVTHLADAGLDAVADSGGVAQRAGAEGAKAHLHGKSPTRAAIATSAIAAVVLLLLSPALLLVYLLSWLVIAAVHRSRATRRRHPATA